MSSETKENDQAPPEPPSEGVAVAGGELEAQASSPPVLVELSDLPPAAPSEITGALVDVVAADFAEKPPEPEEPPGVPALIEQPGAPPEAPSESTGATVEQPGTDAPPVPAAPLEPAIRRVVGLPTQPRLRLHFWFEGNALKCEGALMNDRRELIRRSPIDDPLVARVFAHFASRLVADLRADGAIVTAAPPSSAPAGVLDARRVVGNAIARARARVESSATDSEPTTARDGVPSNEGDKGE